MTGVLVILRPTLMWLSARIPLAAQAAVIIRAVTLTAIGLPATTAAIIILAATRNFTAWGAGLAVCVFTVEYWGSQYAPEIRLWRLVWSTKRRWPTQYAVVDRATADIQASFGGGTSALFKARGTTRPILNHPALAPLPRINWSEGTATWMVYAPPGTTLVALERVAAPLTAAFPFIHRTDIDYPHPGASIGAIRFWYWPPKDPLATAPTLTGTQRDGDPVTAIDIGKRADGGRLIIPAPGHGLVHTFISGKTGSGKSSTVAKLLTGLAVSPNIAFLGIDFKGGLELAPWEPRFTVVATNRDECDRLLDRVNRLIDQRAELIREQGRREGRTLRAWRDDMGPRVVLVVDEGKELTYSKDAVDRLDSIAARGRALGINLIVVTQYGLAKDFPSTLLANLGHRICHRMGTAVQYAVALGVDQTELKEAGVEPIGEDQPGVCYIAGMPGVTDFTRCRSDYVDDTEIDRTAAETAGLRWDEKAIFG